MLPTMMRRTALLGVLACACFVAAAGYFHARAAKEAEAPARPVASSPAAPAPTAHMAPEQPATASPRGLAGLPQPPAPHFVTVEPKPRAGESDSDFERRLYAIAQWETFRADAHLTDEQTAQVLAIVWDVQGDLAAASEEGWHVLEGGPAHGADFTKYEAEKVPLLQADLDARVRALLTPEQADVYRDGQTLSVGRIELIGGLVAAR